MVKLCRRIPNSLLERSRLGPLDPGGLKRLGFYNLLTCFASALLWSPACAVTVTHAMNFLGLVIHSI
ncbi:cb74d784-9022-4374-b469-870d763e772e [Thermothielavioides terrestris]|jgi:hypothetical protein|uniref:Cb74d784-9022-4374-b469-870d763e772e n=1 Tax=Thermothielavioides terrestris TaxID=2587410 RepID=A0A3S4BAN9_9PEZI|nr:cb74d784-9022-4374-b469-870d763e772e [Thermothielavioides terrestris]